MDVPDRTAGAGRRGLEPASRISESDDGQQPSRRRRRLNRPLGPWTTVSRRPGGRTHPLGWPRESIPRGLGIDVQSAPLRRLRDDNASRHEMALRLCREQCQWPLEGRTHEPGSPAGPGTWPPGTPASRASRSTCSCWRTPAAGGKREATRLATRLELYRQSRNSDSSKVSVHGDVRYSHNFECGTSPKASSFALHRAAFLVSWTEAMREGGVRGWGRPSRRDGVGWVTMA